MIRNQPLLITFLILQLCINTTRAQDSRWFGAKLDDFRSAVLQEKIYVHTDRSGYLAGETMWFKVYYVDATFHQPLTLQPIVYVELLDRSHNAVIQEKIQLDPDGTGSGSLFLPTTLHTGQYTFRVYTNWMKNFSPDYFFQKSVPIINSFEGAPPGDDALSASNIQFFPEGGQLVHGLKSKVAFRGVDKNGEPIRFHGVILNANRDTVLTFEPFRFGLGSFVFKPDHDQHYIAKIIDEKGTTSTVPLPEIFEQGYVMNVTDSAQYLQIHISSSKRDDQRQKVYLLLHTRNHGIVAKEGYLENGHHMFHVSKGLLKGGVSHFTVFDETKQPVCERLYFKRSISKLKIISRVNETLHSKRHRVQVDLKIQNGKGEPSQANLSLAVYRLDSLNMLSQEDIFSYLNYTSDLGGEIPNSKYYFDSDSTEEQSIAIDHLMLTHGWRRFRWETILKSSPMPFKHYPEVNGHTVSGKVIYKNSGVPIRNTMAFISETGVDAMLHIVRTDSSGTFHLHTRNLANTDELIIQLQENDYTVEFQNPYSGSAGLILPTLQVDERLRNEINSRSIHLQIENFYHGNRVMRTKSRKYVPPFFGYPDKTYSLDDYMRFPTMEEVLREYVPEVMVRKKSDRFDIRVENSIVDSKTFLDGPPLILVDGVPIFDADNFIDIDPLKIKSLSVINRKYYYGGLSFDGVIDCRSYDGDLTTFASANNFSVLKYQFLMAPREFYSPSYTDNDSSRLPDARTLLHWVPTLQTDENGNAQINFFTSDIRGKYLIVVQGLSPDGEAGYTSTQFTVGN